MTIPKEIHTLNDAILAAAKELSTRPKGRRRVIYVISDGKEYGSKATFKEVLRYLQTNKIAVYGTLVGDSAAGARAGSAASTCPSPCTTTSLQVHCRHRRQADSERNLNGIEKSYAEIAKEARNQYTLVYASHEPPLDGKYRKIDVRVDRPGLEVVAKPGYYPSRRCRARRERLPALHWRGGPDACPRPELNPPGTAGRPPPGAARTSSAAWAHAAPRRCWWSPQAISSPARPFGNLPGRPRISRSPAGTTCSLPRWAALKAQWLWPSSIARWPWAPWA
jgi:hypothetical protein